MNDKNAVIDKRISDAHAAADALRQDARQKAEKIVSAAQKAADAYRKEALSGGEERVALALERAKSVDALDSRRELYACKSPLLDEVFALAAKALKEENAEDGDKVVICKEDEKVVTAAFIASIAKSAKKKITPGGARGEFAGGVVLSGDRYDKNLTLEEEMRLIREECEPLVAKALFKGE